MLKLIFVAIFFILINGCTSQNFYEGAISIVNPCREDLSILVENYTPWIGPVGGGDSIKFLLPKGEKKSLRFFDCQPENRILHIFFLTMEKIFGSSFLMDVTVKY